MMNFRAWYRSAWPGLGLALLLASASASGAVFTVHTVVDDSSAHDVNPGDGICADAVLACTLRTAIEEANALPGFDRIVFTVSGTILISGTVGRLPAITGPLDIDGRSAPGYSGASLDLEQAVPVVAIDGVNLGGQFAIGLDFNGTAASNGAVQALSLIRFDSGFFGEAIRIRGGASNVRVDLCYVGLDLAGLQAGNHTGIYVQSPDNLIGRSLFDLGGGLLVPQGFGNVVSGNRVTGVRLGVGSTGAGTVVGGNRIGTTPDGLSPAPNGRGILAGGGALLGVHSQTISLGNLISGNLGDGIRAEGSGNLIVANRIGVDLNGGPLSNAGAGVIVVGGDNRIGDAPNQPLAANLIANNRPGIEIHGIENLVLGNQLGSMSGAQGNSGAGILIAADIETRDIRVEDNVVLYSAEAGIDVLAAATFIADNIVGLSGTDGIRLRSSDNAVLRNRIGLVDAVTLIGNARHGISLDGNSGNNTVRDNTIAFNAESGVRLGSNAGSENALRANSIHDNGQLGIDIDPTGPNVNDPGDADSGSNNLQNYPEILSVDVDETVSPTELTVQWRIDSLTANALYDIDVEFYLADSESGGAGKIYLASDHATEPDVIYLSSFALPGGASGRFLVATATDDFGFGNTSEFSPVMDFGPRDAIFSDGFEPAQ